jgi:hypothetical protein
MGNYGNTLDRWYHRGAVVLWPRRRSFTVRAEARPSWALDQLIGWSNAGDLERARASAALLGPFWGRGWRARDDRSLFTKALRAARRLEEPALAAMLVQPFDLELIGAGQVKDLAALALQYGNEWVVKVGTSWSGGSRWIATLTDETREWTGALPRLCSALGAAAGDGTLVADALLRASWARCRESFDRGLQLGRPSERERALATYARPFSALLQAASIVGARDVREEVVTSLCGRDQCLQRCAMATLRATPRRRWEPDGLDDVARHCTTMLRSRVDRPPRSAGDWSLELGDGCPCELCDLLRQFLADHSERTLEWPIKQDDRRHVHSVIEEAELPVDHTTRRQGRPYTLVLRKTEQTFEREARARRRDEKDLAWLDDQGRY